MNARVVVAGIDHHGDPIPPDKPNSVLRTSRMKICTKYIPKLQVAISLINIACGSVIYLPNSRRILNAAADAIITRGDKYS
jgi:hypothetical protein